MHEEFERRAAEYFERVLDRIAAHARYGALVQRAVDARRRLILNYHTHGPGSGYCVSICTRDEVPAWVRVEPSLEELAHVRNIAREESDCDPLMRVFAERLKARYAVADEPEVFLNGHPRRADR